MRLSYKPVRKGIRTEKQIWTLFQPSKIAEVATIPMYEEPFRRVHFDGETYSNQAKNMDSLVTRFSSTVRGNPNDSCEQLKKQKAKWEAENLS